VDATYTSRPLNLYELRTAYIDTYKYIKYDVK